MLQQRKGRGWGKSSGKNLIKKCLTHPFPESDNLHSAAPFVCRLIICRAREDPSVYPRQPRSAASGSGRRTMSHFAARLGSARGRKGGWRGGEATSRTRKFPNYVPEPGFAFLPPSFSSAVRTVTWRWGGGGRSKIGARDSPGFDSLANVRHWKGPLTGATL